MEKMIKGIMIFSMVSLFSCTKVLYTHDQVLGRYKTMQDVEKTFGIPTEKTMNDISESWLYRYDRDTLKSNSVELHQNLRTDTVNAFNKYDRYLVFSFDKKGKVIKCDYTGVDLTVRKLKPGATIATVGGIAVGVAVMVFAITFITDLKDAADAVNKLGN
jgi:hypothetical protein